MDKAVSENTGQALKLRTQKQNRQLHYWLAEAKIGTEVKEELVHNFSGGRATSSNLLTVDQCNMLISYLKGLCEARKETAVPSRASGTGAGLSPSGLRPPPQGEDKANRMRRKCISICHEMGWKLENGKIDMRRVDEFCEKRGHGHKKLNFYSEKELPMLITQFEKLLKSKYAKG